MKGKNSRYLLTIIACCGLSASSIGVFTNSVGVFYTSVAEALDAGRGAVALHATLTLLASGILSPLVAKLLAKYPLRPLLCAGVGLACLSTALMGFSHNLVQLYVLGTIKGLGMSTFSLMTVTAVIGNWFQQKHGLAVGVAMAFSGLSGAIFSPLFGWLIEASGWQQAYILSALIALVMALPALLTLRFTPEEISMPPYGGEIREKPEDGGVPERIPAAKVYLPLLAIMCVVTLLHTCIPSIAQHFPGFSESVGMGAQVGATMVSAAMIGNIVTKLVIGTLSDKAGPFKASGVMLIINAVSLGVLLIFAGNPTVELIAAFFYGSVYSVGAVGITLVTRSLFGVRQYASAYSVLTIFLSIGSAVSLTIIGLVYDLTGGYTAAFLGGILINVINLGLLVAAYMIKQKRFHGREALAETANVK